MFEINAVIILYIPILGLIATIVAALLCKGVNRWIALYYVPFLTLVIFFCSGVIFLKPSLDNGYGLGVALAFMILAGVIIVHYIIISAIAVWLHFRNRKTPQVVPDGLKLSDNIAKKIVLLASITVFIIFCAWLFDKLNMQNQEIKMENGEAEIQKIINAQVEEQKTEKQNLIGGQKDAHGCLPAAGYVWCPSEEKCLRAWEEYCEEFKDQYRGNDTSKI